MSITSYFYQSDDWIPSNTIYQNNIDLEKLSEFFHLPITEVAIKMGVRFSQLDTVCATVLKKICRKNGIPRWPHRKIKSLDKMISNLESIVTKSPAHQARIEEEINVVRSNKEYLVKNPSAIVDCTSLKNKRASDRFKSRQTNRVAHRNLAASPSHTVLGDGSFDDFSQDHTESNSESTASALFDDSAEDIAMNLMPTRKNIKSDHVYPNRSSFTFSSSKRPDSLSNPDRQRVSRLSDLNGAVGLNHGCNQFNQDASYPLPTMANNPSAHLYNPSPSLLATITKKGGSSINHTMVPMLNVRGRAGPILLSDSDMVSTPPTPSHHSSDFRQSNHYCPVPFFYIGAQSYPHPHLQPPPPPSSYLPNFTDPMMANYFHFISTLSSAESSQIGSKNRNVQVVDQDMAMQSPPPREYSSCSTESPSPMDDDRPISLMYLAMAVEEEDIRRSKMADNATTNSKLPGDSFTNTATMTNLSENQKWSNKVMGGAGTGARMLSISNDSILINGGAVRQSCALDTSKPFPDGKKGSETSTLVS